MYLTTKISLESLVHADIENLTWFVLWKLNNAFKIQVVPEVKWPKITFYFNLFYTTVMFV